MIIFALESLPYNDWTKASQAFCRQPDSSRVRSRKPEENKAEETGNVES
jgi:hypothetical protein